ncbi:MAG: helix-turn-helix transcriptional regulator [Clostridia bacterium]|nr:helix-turn-helix transcriptional regulator [Clostridia bacterium]
MNRMKMYRKEKKLTLKQLSALTNISVGYLCHLENGSRNNPSMNVLNKIATALDRSVEEVFFN